MKFIKSLFIYFLSLGILLGVASCESKILSQSGTAEISGRLLQSCNNPTPIAGVEVHWGAGGHTVYTCVTDSTGAFSISGSYNVTMTQADLGYALWLEGEAPFYYKELLGNVKNPGDIGSVYYDNWLSYVLKVDVEDESVWSDSDTLYFRKSRAGMSSALTYVGPFVDGQVLDTLYLESASHVGYPTEDYISFGLPFTVNGGASKVARFSYVFGRDNDVCSETLELVAELKK